VAELVMATFPLIPQDVLVDVRADVTARTVAPSPLATQVGRTSDRLGHALRLSFSLLTTEDARTLRRFYLTHGGPFTTWDFVHPTDSTVYRCRFAGPLPTTLFQPGFQRTTELTVEVVGP
jgi:hypothetical protein